MHGILNINQQRTIVGLVKLVQPRRYRDPVQGSHITNIKPTHETYEILSCIYSIRDSYCIIWRKDSGALFPLRVALIRKEAFRLRVACGKTCLFFCGRVHDLWSIFSLHSTRSATKGYTLKDSKSWTEFTCPCAQYRRFDCTFRYITYINDSFRDWI